MKRTAPTLTVAVVVLLMAGLGAVNIVQGNFMEPWPIRTTLPTVKLIKPENNTACNSNLNVTFVVEKPN